MNLIESYIHIRKEITFLDNLFGTSNDIQKDYISYHTNALIEKELDIVEYLSEEDYNSLPYDVEVTAEDEKAFSHHMEILNSFNTLDKTIEEVRDIISIRLYSVLKLNGIETVQQLAEMTLDEISSLRNMGRVSLQEVKEVFGVYINFYNQYQ